MLKELSENLNSMKKIQSEMKDTPVEIRNNLQGNNSRVDEARFKSMVWNIRKQKKKKKKTIHNNKKKKESKRK